MFSKTPNPVSKFLPFLLVYKPFDKLDLYWQLIILSTFLHSEKKINKTLAEDELTGSAEEKEAAFVNELMRYNAAGESKALVERNESNPPPSLLDSLSSDQLGEEEVKRGRVLEMEKRFLWSNLVLLRIDCIFLPQREDSI